MVKNFYRVFMVLMVSSRCWFSDLEGQSVSINTFILASYRPKLQNSFDQIFLKEKIEQLGSQIFQKKCPLV